MTSGRIGALALLFAIAGTLAILAPAVIISWQFAVSAQRADLKQSAVRVLTRADVIYADAAHALDMISKGGPRGCSPEHIALMARVVLASLNVNDAAYGSDGYVQCTAFGAARRPIRTNAVDVVQPDGNALHLNWNSGVPDGGPLLIVTRGPYAVLVDQRHFYDVVERTGVSEHIAVSTHNGLVLEPIAETNPAPHTHPPEDLIHETVRSENWIVSIDAARIGFVDFLRPLEITLVPLGGALALLCGGSAAWLLRRRISARSEILAGLHNHEFVVHYQPIMELATRRCIGAEALVRWRRPDGTLVRPDLFIPVAEETGLSSAITDVVVETVVREAGRLLRADAGMHVAINLSAADITSGRIIDLMERALKGTNIAPGQIWLEATERGFINTASARSTLAELRRRGHRTAIDDFGTGYSSLQYLKDLPVDLLKIDKAFIDTVGTDAATSQVTAHIVAMARELKLGLVAEGVETEEQCAFLLAQKVEFAQGWLFSPALPIDEFLAFCAHTHNGRDLTAAVE